MFVRSCKEKNDNKCVGDDNTSVCDIWHFALFHQGRSSFNSNHLVDVKNLKDFAIKDLTLDTHRLDIS